VGDVVNLRLARKRRDREVKAATADANRVAHGRTKAEKTETLAVQRREARRLDGHLRTPETSGDDA
jgi:hypothetical protein